MNATFIFWSNFVLIYEVRKENMVFYISIMYFFILCYTLYITGYVNHAVLIKGFKYNTLNAKTMFITIEARGN